MVGDYINTMETTFYLSFVCEQAFFYLQVNSCHQKEAFFINNLLYFHAYVKPIHASVKPLITNTSPGRIYQMSSRQFLNEFYTILRKFQYLRK